MEIKDRVVIVTGASSGIGLAAARRFAVDGARVVLAARSADRVKQIARELRNQGYDALAVPADITDQKAVAHLVDAAVQEFGRVDMLVNNAGVSVGGTVADLNVDNFRQVMETNVFGPLYAMQAVIPRMREAGGGVIINISSMVSKMHIPGLAGYASTKAALNMFSDSARGELERDNIRVISVFPRVTATNFFRNRLGATGTGRPAGGRPHGARYGRVRGREDRAGQRERSRPSSTWSKHME